VASYSQGKVEQLNAMGENLKSWPAYILFNFGEIPQAL